MVKLPVVNQSGQQVGEYEFDPQELSPEVNKQLLHDVVVMYQTNRRQGTVKTKGRGEIAGSTKKLFKQKGTGRARMGPKRSPIRRGGGHAHPLRPKDYSYRLPRKAVQLATRMALRSKFEDQQVVVLDGFQLSNPARPKTREVAALLKALKVSDKSCLLAVPEYSEVLLQSCRNIPTLALLPAADLNAFELLHKHRLVVTRAALDALRARSRSVKASD